VQAGIADIGVGGTHHATMSSPEFSHPCSVV
jgi:hypothetical protein